MQVEPKRLLEATGKLIAQRRKERGLTQEDFAKKMGCSRQAIATLETGRTEFYLRHLYEIAQCLGVEPEALVPQPESIDTDALKSLLPKDLSFQEVELYRAILSFDQTQ